MTTHSEATAEPPAPRPPRASIRRDVASTTATNLVISAANVLTGVVVARMLNPAGRGELAAILNWPTFLGMLTTLGMTEALVYYPARQAKRTGRYLGTGLVLALSASVAFMVVGWLLMPTLLAAQEPAVIAGARWYLVQVPIAAVFGLIISPLRGLSDIRAWNLLRVAPTMIWLGTALWFVAFVDRPEPTELAITFVAVRLLLLPLAVWVVRRRLGQAFRPEVALVRPLLRFGVPSALATFPSTLNVRLDQLLIAAVLPPGGLGIYAVAVSWSMIPSPVLLAFGNVLFPRVAEHLESDAGAALAGRGVRTAVVLSGVLASATLLITPVGLPLLFGHRFDVAVPTALVLTVAGAIMGVTSVQQEALRGLGRTTAVLWSQLIGLAVTLAGLAITVPTEGLAWIAMASVAGYAVLGVALLAHLVRATGLPLHEFIVPRRSDLDALVEVVHGRRRRHRDLP
jgi:O-antigen/teichoic acid export membrane protein